MERNMDFCTFAFFFETVIMETDYLKGDDNDNENYQYYRRYFLPCFWSFFVELSLENTCDFLASLWFDAAVRCYCSADL